MWPRINNNVITFLCTPRIRAAALFTPTTGSKPFAVQAFEVDTITDNARIDNIEYHPEQFKLFAHSFTRTHAVEHAFVAYALSNHGITEELITHHSSSPHRDEIYEPMLRNCQWNFRYVCPSHDGQFIFYRVGIPRPVLLQYQVLATACSHNVIRLTTQFESYFTVYHYIRGATFRQSQLACDLERHDYQLSALVDPLIVRRIIHTPAHLSQQAQEHTEYLVALFGLYLNTYLHDLQGDTL